MAGICYSELMTPQLPGFPNHFHVLLSESVDGQSREGRPPLLDLGAGLEGATFLSPALVWELYNCASVKCELCSVQHFPFVSCHPSVA